MSQDKYVYSDKDTTVTAQQLYQLTKNEKKPFRSATTLGCRRRSNEIIPSIVDSDDVKYNLRVYLRTVPRLADMALFSTGEAYSSPILHTVGQKTAVGFTHASWHQAGTI